MIVRSRKKHVSRDGFLAGTLVAAVFLFSCAAHAQVTALTPEEISGISVRDIDAIHQMSRSYAQSPDGGEVPKSADDDWFPDMSLAAPSVSQILSGTGDQTADGQSADNDQNGNQNSNQNNNANQNNSGRNVNSAAAAAVLSMTSEGVNYVNGDVAPAVAAATTGSRVSFDTMTPGITTLGDSSIPAFDALSIEPVSQAPAGSVSVDQTPAGPMPASDPLPIGAAADSGVVAFPAITETVTIPAERPAENNTAESAAAAAPGDSVSFPLPDIGGDATAVAETAAAPAAPSTAVPDAGVPLLASGAAAPLSDFGAAPADAPAEQLPLTMPEAASEPLPAPPAAMDTKSAPAEPMPQIEKLPDPEGKIVADILCSEGLEMPIARFNKLIKTKIGSTFSQQRLEEDKRALLQTKQYVDVLVSTSMIPDEPDKVIVNFDFTPRRQMRYIKVIGNKKFSKTEILNELGMKRGESRMDPYDVENGRLRIIELYKSKEYSEPHVEILRGNRPEDIGVVYLIDEGMKQHVLKTRFSGNTVVSSARLKSLVSEKPGVLYLIGGDFSRERLDDDVTKLLEYYRNLGYFDARIDREYEEGNWYGGLGRDNAWITVHFIIDEGPRYRIRNFLFEGNRVLSSDKLRDMLNVKEGDYFNQSELEGDRIKLANAYQDIGYVRAEVTPSQIFTEKEAEIDIRYRIDEDYRYRIKDIVIQYEGDESRTKSSVVMNLLDFAPSQIAVGPKIRSSEANLQRSGYFNDKASDGPLPSIAIVPEEENLYFSQVTAADGTRETAPSVDDYIPAKKEKKGTTFLGLKSLSLGKPDSAKSDSGISSDSIKSPSQKEQSPREGSAQKPVVDPDESPLPSYGSSIVRGQMRENIPTSFSNSTTTPGSSYTQSGSSAWNGSSYISYPSSGTANKYADTSKYNNSAEADTTAPPLATAMAGTGSASGGDNLPGLYSGTINGEINPSQVEYNAVAPGFSTGRDAVFPGSQQQQYLDSQVGNGAGTDPIRNATVIARIMEGRTGMLQASVGVNSNYGLIGNVSYTERNFDILRWPTAFWRSDGWADAFRGGGQIFRVEASPGTSLQRYSISWDVPYIFDSRFNFGVTGLYADRYFDDWYETRAGGDLRLGRSWTNRFSTTLDLGLYDVRIYRPSTEIIPDLNDVLGHNAQYSIGLTASYDTRNHPYMPSQGYVITGSAEQVLGAYSYPRLSYDARTYFTLHKRADGSGKKVLGLRSAAGWSGDNTPIYDRYYGGGYSNLRGFEYRGVTPRYGSTHYGIGGKFEFYNSAELLVPISGGDELQLAFFVDSGTVAENINKWGNYRVAPGVGLRIAIPMLGPAPLAIDFAFPVSKSDEDDTEVFSFSIVGSR
ncbi:MAG: BamA/TamA family outer membrane protein [Thermoguttaceae bacterium]|nr:BamA/TamA family outer membrane protein [Thermoguttaceae bacterium]